MRRSNVFRIQTLVIFFVIVIVSVLIVQHSVIAQPNSTASASPTPNTIFKQVENSVVQITSKVPPIPSNNPQNPQAPNATALGSGFVYDKLGRIITNNHVVGDAKIVDVTFVDGNRYTAKVVGSDIYSDIAVLQVIENITQQPLKPLVIGNSSKLEVGDPVIAIGNPFGLSGTITTGIVSGIGRLLPAAAGLGFSIPNAIQTDAPINPGSSGGPLLNMQGQVVGINTAGISSSIGFSGVAFAIPSSTITRIVPTLIEKGNYTHSYIGLSGATLTSDLAQTIVGLPANFKGIVVDSIVKDGPADKAGIHGSTTDQYSKKHGGDVITAIDGHPVTKIDDLISYLEEHKSVANSITFTVYRNGQSLDLKTTLTARPSPLPFLPVLSSPPSNPSPRPPSP
ncbi:MAG TPA: trypsin-like peptidase domain-containing protein [Nitrososphaeraceae archaeon]